MAPSHIIRAIAIVVAAGALLAAPVASQTLEIKSWQEMADLENSLRAQRFERLGEKLPLVLKPTVQELRSGAVTFGSSTQSYPLLRVAFGANAFFDPGSSVLSPQAIPALDAVAEALRLEPPDVAIFVTGHSASDGDPDKNFNLSVTRAEVVAGALVARGVGTVRLYRVGFGDEMPIRDNATEQGKAANRRVEFVFAPQPEVGIAWLETQLLAPCVEGWSGPEASCLRKLQSRGSKPAGPITPVEVVRGITKPYETKPVDLKEMKSRGPRG